MAKKEFEVNCPEHGDDHFVGFKCSCCGGNNVDIVMLIGKCNNCGYLETGHIKDYEDIWEDKS